MKGDFTRRTFRSEHHYRGVLLQQGRVHLDADWNEQVDIEDHLRRAAIRDVIGPHGAPIDAAGFAITFESGAPFISAGHYYVNGILCENEASTDMANQPDYPVPLPSSPGDYLAYLDVSTEHLTALEKPSLREGALRGPDTATRTRTRWQLRLQSLGQNETIKEPWLPADAIVSTGQMRAQTEATAAAGSEPCAISGAAGYRKLENQLYRVEVHRVVVPAGGADATDEAPAADTGYDQEIYFLWAQDNASVAARPIEIREPSATNGEKAVTVKLAETGRDDRHAFLKGFWLEINSEARLRQNQPGFVGKITSVVKLDDNEELTVVGVDFNNAIEGIREDLEKANRVGKENAELPVLVRRWNGYGDVSFSADSSEDNWVALDDPDGSKTGIQVEFSKGRYHPGDYWLIPARTVTGGIEWPTSPACVPQLLSPEGIRHAYAPIARLNYSGQAWTLTWDHRRLFPRLADDTRQVEFAGGDGQEALPGQALAQPLRVSVRNGPVPVTGARIRFAVVTGEGRLAATPGGLGTSPRTELIVLTGPDGIAECYWKLGSLAASSQTVAAQLVGATDQGVGTPIKFSANVSDASLVALTAVAPLAGASTVAQGFERLVTARSLVALGGGGQHGVPNSELTQPVEVLVRSDRGPVAGAKVTFEVSTGSVQGTGGSATSVDVITDGKAAGVPSVDVFTDSQGVAACRWTLGPADDPVQVLTATLQALPPDRAAGVVDVPPTMLKFSANTGDAGHINVRAPSSSLAGSSTVQDALLHLASAHWLTKIGGDGQLGSPGKALAEPVTVLVRSSTGPVPGIQVIFEPSNPSGQVRPAEGTTGTPTDGGAAASWQSAVTVTTGADGHASCDWLLGTVEAQTLIAAFPATDMCVLPPIDRYFTATAAQVAALTEVSTVGGELPLTEGCSLEPTQLMDGIRFRFDGQPAAAASGDDPQVRLTLDLPQSAPAIATGLIGTSPIALDGEVKVDPDDQNAQIWTMNPAAHTFVTQQLFEQPEVAGVGRVRCQLRFTHPGSQDTVALSRVFWLVPAVTSLVVLPRRNELFRLRKVREALTLVPSVAALRAALPGDVRVLERDEAMLPASRKSAERGLRRGVGRALVLVVDGRYSDVAQVVRDSLAGVNLPIEIVSSVDPVAEARRRIEAEELFDGVLTDSKAIAAITALDGFAEAIYL